jgi:hypothetical protein
MRYLLAAGFLSLTAYGVLGAQTVQGGGFQPSPTDCSTAAQALAAGTPEWPTWDYLPACGRVGGRALATALRSARSSSDLGYLERLYGAAASMRDPDLFESALDVLQDETGSNQARSTAILIALAQHDNAVGLPLNLSLTDALRSGRCRLLPYTHAGYRTATPVPANYRDRLGKALLDVSADPTTPEPVKTFVNCTRPLLAGEIANAVPLSDLRLIYVCDNRYRVENHSTEELQLSLTVAGSKEKADLVVPAKGALTTTNNERGTTSLYHRGKLVQSVANSGTTCNKPK